MNENEPPRIKRLRLALRWSQTRMAEWLGLTQAAVSLMEKGQAESGPVSKLLDLLAAHIDADGAAVAAKAVADPFSNEAAEWSAPGRCGN
ncbi:DNA-binding transcriptional regulator [Methylosinus sp. Sm6]|uniref:helix-turn-helix domain-containing protein n=1 Tax=Methylosinus sp. Sm6 TaxID=2866948 RepID=UPI001C99E75A|nr:XRE family transcriptional regulator [Methylosinus sp. Sm6]MBY6239837.1 helix-turn-helix domain-containing protein [Methylosinus sp. Sm6]